MSKKTRTLKYYTVETAPKFDKQIKKLDKFTQSQILKWLYKNIEGTSNPRQHGKGLVSDRSGQWRYRVGDYRVIVRIDDDIVVVTALEVGHRRDVYK